MTAENGLARLRRACERNAAGLTARELEVAYEIAVNGRATVTLAAVLTIEAKTVEAHITRIAAKVVSAEARVSGARGLWRVTLARWYGQQEVLDLAAEGGLVPADRLGRCSTCGRERDAVWPAEDGTPDAFGRHDNCESDHARYGCHPYRMTAAS